MHWLLEIVVEGRTYRWSVDRIEVDATHIYRPGLSDLEVEDGAERIAIQVQDARAAWTSLAPRMQGARAVLRRWLAGTTYDEALVVLAGALVEVEYDTDDQPMRCKIDSDSELVVGLPVPDAFSRAGALTWPVTGTLGDEGVAYPVIFGFPGYEGTATPYPVVPVALAQWSATRADTLAIVSEDPDLDLTGCRIRNDVTVGEADQTVAGKVDLLGKGVRAATFADSATGYPATATDARSLFAGFHPDTGGGPRSAWEVVTYLCRRWAPDTLEWDRAAEVEELLSAYLVDTWIDQPMSDAWTWLESVLLPDLPVVVRIGPTGRRYLVGRDWTPSGARVVAELTTGRHLEAASTVRTETPGPTNEFTADYREDRAGVYRARVVVTGGVSARELASSVPLTAEPGSTSSQSVTVIRSGICADSRARFGLRRARGVQVIDWTWDEGTVLRVLEDRVAREAIPALVTRYAVVDRMRFDLREGDTVRITDDERGWTSKLATIVAPPRLAADRTTITLRVPR